MSSFAQQPSDSFHVTDPLDVTHYPSPVIDISNKSSGAVCLNIFMYDPAPANEKSLIACCSTMVQPDSLYTMGSKNQAVWATGSNYCNPSAPLQNAFFSGLSASINGAPLPKRTPDPCFSKINGACVNEIDFNRQVCGFIQTGQAFWMLFFH